MKFNLGGYPLILGIPLLAIVNAYISCISRDMTISHKNSTKNISLYPLAMPSFDSEISPWFEYNDEESTQPLLTLDQASTFRKYIEDDFICTFITHPHIANHATFNHILEKNFQETHSPIELTQ
jgi:hypothetical protein